MKLVFRARDKTNQWISHWVFWECSENGAATEIPAWILKFYNKVVR